MIELKEVTKEYSKGIAALNGVSLKIENEDEFPNYDVAYGKYENGEWHIEGDYKNYTVLAWTSQMIPFIPEL